MREGGNEGGREGGREEGGRGGRGHFTHSYIPYTVELWDQLYREAGPLAI